MTTSVELMKDKLYFIVGSNSRLATEFLNILDHKKFIKIPKGEPENFMDDSEFISKFRSLTEPYLSNMRIDELTNLMLKIDQSNNINSIFEYSQIDR